MAVRQQKCRVFLAFRCRLRSALESRFLDCLGTYSSGSGSAGSISRSSSKHGCFRFGTRSEVEGVCAGVSLGEFVVGVRNGFGVQLPDCGRERVS